MKLGLSKIENPLNLLNTCENLSMVDEVISVTEQNGPSTFEKAGEMAVEATKIGVSDVQATSSHDRHTRPLNSTETNTVSSVDVHTVLPVDHGGRNTNDITHSDPRHSGSPVPILRC